MPHSFCFTFVKLVPWKLWSENMLYDLMWIQNLNIGNPNWVSLDKDGPSGFDQIAKIGWGGGTGPRPLRKSLVLLCLISDVIFFLWSWLLWVCWSARWGSKSNQLEISCLQPWSQTQWLHNFSHVLSCIIFHGHQSQNMNIGAARWCSINSSIQQTKGFAIQSELHKSWPQ